jgi:hypothetical protein
VQTKDADLELGVLRNRNTSDFYILNCIVRSR